MGIIIQGELKTPITEKRENKFINNAKETADPSERRQKNVPFEVKSKRRFLDFKTAKAMSEVEVHGDRS